MFWFYWLPFEFIIKCNKLSAADRADCAWFVKSNFHYAINNWPQQTPLNHVKNRQIREAALLHGPMYPNREHSAIWRLLIGMDLCRYVWLIMPMFFFLLAFMFQLNQLSHTLIYTRTSTVINTIGFSFHFRFIANAKARMPLCKVMTVNRQRRQACTMWGLSSFYFCRPLTNWICRHFQSHFCGHFCIFLLAQTKKFFLKILYTARVSPFHDFIKISPDSCSINSMTFVLHRLNSIWALAPPSERNNQYFTAGGLK